MLEAILVFLLALAPPLFSLWVLRHAEAQARARLNAAMEGVAVQGLRSLHVSSGDRYYIQGIGYQIGDITCQYNAHSAYLRCAVNPSGPCQECPHYKSLEFT